MAVTIFTAKQLSNEAYHASPAWGSSRLRTFIQNRPLAYAMATGRFTKESTPALEFGRLFHDKFDPGVDFKNTYEIGPDADKRSKAWKDAEAAAIAVGKRLLHPGQAALADKMVAAVRMNPYAAAILDGAEHETSFRMPSPYGGCDLQCRADILHRWTLIADLKTIDNVDSFSRSVVDHEYYIQAALYRYVIAAACGKLLPFLFIVVEKQAPHRCRVVELSDEYLSLGRALFELALRDLATCYRLDDWSDPTPSMELEPPDWLLHRHRNDLEAHDAA